MFDPPACDTFAGQWTAKGKTDKGVGQMRKDRPQIAGSIWTWVCLAGAMLGWAWAWVGIREAVQSYDPGALALGRYLVASLALLPVWWWRGANRPARADVPLLAVLGLLGFTFYNLCINVGERTITAGAGAFIAASIPVLLTIGGRMFFAERLTPVGWLGVAVALGGVGVTTVGAEGRLQLSAGALLVLLASVSAAGYGLLSKRLLTRYGSLELTTWAIWAGTVGLIPTGLGLPKAVLGAPVRATLTVVLLGVIPAALCYTLWNYCVSRLPLARASSAHFMVPLASVALGWLFLGELPPRVALLGGGITLAGVFLVNRKAGPR